MEGPVRTRVQEHSVVWRAGADDSPGARRLEGKPRLEVPQRHETEHARRKGNGGSGRTSPATLMLGHGLCREEPPPTRAALPLEPLLDSRAELIDVRTAALGLC